MIDMIRHQTMALRTTAAKLLRELPADCVDDIPPTWKNNARWHVGHLVVTPRLLTYGLLGEPLGVPEDFRRWFGKGSSPSDWAGQSIPSFEQLLHDLTAKSEELFTAMASRIDEKFAKPYATTPGAVLNSVGESLNFSQAHDGIHLGLILALRRALTMAPVK